MIEGRAAVGGAILDGLIGDSANPAPMGSATTAVSELLRENKPILKSLYVFTTSFIPFPISGGG
jgi:hypothetical protein